MYGHGAALASYTNCSCTYLVTLGRVPGLIPTLKDRSGWGRGAQWCLMLHV